MMPAGAIDLLQPCDAILLGAVGHPEIPDHTTLNGLLLPIRRAFDQYANVRPAYLYPGVDSPLARPQGRRIDMVVVRENTEGEYAQVGGFVYHMQPEEVAIQTSVFTRRGIERIVRFAFELAVKRNKKKRVTSITKSNAQGYSMVLWDRAFEEVAAEFPDIETESLLVDAAAMNFIRRPESFDVVVGSNLFGDILSDISAIIVGSMGLAASANLDPAAPLSLDVRARARLRARYRRQGHRESAGHHPERRHDARPSGHGARRRAKWKPPWPRCWPKARCARPISAAAAAPRKSPTRCWRNSASGRGDNPGEHRPPRFSGGRGDSAEPHRGPGAAARLLALLRPARRSATRSTPPSASPISCRTCSAKACSRPRSSRSMRACWPQGDEEEADRVAGAVGAILALGRVGDRAAGRAGYAVSDRWAIAPGFDGAKRELTIRLVRILFPGAGLLVLSAWCLGILNSHRKFFLSYTAPVMWNVAMIAHPAGFSARRTAASLAVDAGVGLGGRAARCSSPCSCRWCCVWRGKLRLRLETHVGPRARGRPQFRPGLRQPRRGADQRLRGSGCWRACWARARWPRLTNAQTLYMLPVSLFGMAVSAAELPAMSSALGHGSGSRRCACAGRLNAGLRQIAFFIVPSAMAFFALGDVIAAALTSPANSRTQDSRLRLGNPRGLGGRPAGLHARAASTLRPTTPCATRERRCASRSMRVALTTGLGYLCALPLPRWLGIDPHWGVAGLTASAGVAGWVEFTLLRRTLNARIGTTGVPAPLIAKLWGSAAVGAAAAWGIKLAIRGIRILSATAIFVLVPYGLIYFAVAYLLRVEECGAMFQRLARFRR